MRLRKNLVRATVVLFALSVSGCARVRCDYLVCYEPAPLGTISDPIWQQQEANAEASDFVIHVHEFVGDTARLNHAGEQHVKQIAARAELTPFPILIEPSSMSRREGDGFGFPIHPNSQLDLRRRGLIVRTLTEMGVFEADRRVLVSPALTPGFENFEAERAYSNVSAHMETGASDGPHGF